jgi:hypothetical protein
MVQICLIKSFVLFVCFMYGIYGFELQAWGAWNRADDIHYEAAAWSTKFVVQCNCSQRCVQPDTVTKLESISASFRHLACGTSFQNSTFKLKFVNRPHPSGFPTMQFLLQQMFSLAAFWEPAKRCWSHQPRMDLPERQNRLEVHEERFAIDVSRPCIIASRDIHI